ncbi:trypsin inhibitor DE5 alpha chain-like [Prosopis cineraria]|uniref:trypsin inhibitor DE5 alpha chain-like n=1 Tax=Prosopis cineraria TaxID=364024 RepID=UPI0024106341|nr:trypsin inhibitor DE5 alpha chain-like [Prosopis cineraria]
MKPSLFSLFVLFAFFTSLTTAKFLLDSQGEPIENGGSYYILPHIWPIGGGLDLAKTGNETCPYSVVQLPYSIDTDYGLPWIVTSPLKIRYITPSINVDFFSVEGKVPSCVLVPSKWTIVEEDGVKSVKISGGYEKTLQGSFRIQPYTLFAYKIVFCPLNGDSCRDLGIARGNDGNSLLVITDDYLLIAVFIKAESYNARRASIM